MFKNSKIVNNAIAMDYLVLAEYAQNFKKGTDGAPTLTLSASPLAGLKNYRFAYESALGAGRITFGKR